MKKKLAKISSALMAGLFFLSGCGESGAQAVNKFGKKEFLGTKEVGSEVVNVYGDDETDATYQTVAFEETNELCEENEGMGWCVLEEPLKGGLPSLGYKGNLPEVKVVSLSTGWSCFEETPGNYDWTVMDETIEYWVKQGKLINLRLCTDGLDLNQGVVNGCPAWLFEAPYNVPKIINSGSIYADLSSKVYQEELRKFLMEFAGHYTSEDYPYRDAIEVVELRGYGMVGEWHSGWNTYNTIEERTEALCTTIDMWREAWGDTLLTISCTYEFLSNMWGVNDAKSYDDFMYWMGYDHVLTLENISFRRDGIAFALQEYDSRMATDYFYLNTGLPLFGEVGDGYHKHTDNDPYPLFEALNEALHKWRVSYNTVIGWVAQDFNNVIINDWQMVEYFNRYQGFRLVPNKVQYSHQVKAGDTLYLNTLWTNQAMGRCWYDYDLSVYLENAAGETVYVGTDASFQPVSINGGEPHFFNLTYSLPENLPAGTYTLKMAVTDNEGNPRIQLPIAGNDGENKYYVGEVTVGDKAAKDITGTETFDKSGSFTVTGNGKMTDRLVTVDSTKAIVGGGSEVFAVGQKLENGKTYYISFDYKTDKPNEEISITDASRYVVGAYEKSGKTFGDSYKWLDVSNDPSHRSATIRVPDDGKTYYAAFGGMNEAAPIAIDNVTVMEADVLETGWRINPNFTVKGEDGTYEIASTLNKAWSDGLQLKERLDPHATYMITFDAATIQEISGGAFFYVRMSDSKVDDTDKYDSITCFTQNRIGSWWAPSDYGYMKYSFVFNTEDYTADNHVVIGVRNMGGISVKNITVTRIDTDYSYAMDDIVIKHNVVPEKNIDVDTNGVVENFEAGVFNGGCMYPGLSTGIIRRNKYVISGNYSCYIDNYNPNSKNYEFNVFCQTNRSDLIFSPNTTYRVRFKFMIIEPVKAEEDGRFYCLAREEGSFAHDVGVFEWKNEYETGKVYSVEYEFTTGNNDLYYFMWGVHNYGGIAIDDVTFDKVTPSGQTVAKVTKGHAYQVTQEVLYAREGEVLGGDETESNEPSEASFTVAKPTEESLGVKQAESAYLFPSNGISSENRENTFVRSTLTASDKRTV